MSRRWIATALVLLALLLGGVGAWTLQGRRPSERPVQVASVEVSPHVVGDAAGPGGAAPQGPPSAAPASSPPQDLGPLVRVSPSPAASPRRKKLEIEPRDYRELLKNPSRLGFHPDEQLFRRVYLSIQDGFVEPVNEDKLFQGVVAEVGNLLKQAGVSTDGLKKLDKNKNVLRQLVQMYGARIHKDLLVYAAINGMLDGLGDPYTVLMDPQEYSKLQEQVQSKEFGGIGIYIELDKDNNNQLTVFEPIEGTPAYEAGLEAGDKILAIDGKSTKGITLDGAQSSIRGPEGTKVRLTIQRNGKKLDFTITRRQIHVVSVTSKMLPNKIGYVRLRLFGNRTVEELEQALTRLRGQGARGFIIDLRNNGGGYIDAAVGVVSQFTEPGSLVVYTLDRGGNRRNYTSSQSGNPLRLPMVVLINRYSASASEITAGALRDHKIATLVGEHSFGKGSVQQLYPFPDGSALKVTIARFYSPAGQVIDAEGIEPEYSLEMEPRYVGKDRDTQLKKALEVLEKLAATSAR